VEDAPLPLKAPQKWGAFSFTKAGVLLRFKAFVFQKCYGASGGFGYHGIDFCRIALKAKETALAAIFTITQKMNLLMPGSPEELEAIGGPAATFTMRMVNDPPHLEMVLPFTIAVYCYLSLLAWWWMRIPSQSKGTRKSPRI